MNNTEFMDLLGHRMRFTHETGNTFTGRVVSVKVWVSEFSNLPSIDLQLKSDRITNLEYSREGDVFYNPCYGRLEYQDLD